MATSYKILGNSIPAAGVMTTLYSPSGVMAVGSTLVICNQGVTTTVQAAVSPGGAALANSQYILYNTTVNQYDSLYLTIGMTLASTDVVRVSSVSGQTSFVLFGSEIV